MMTPGEDGYALLTALWFMLLLSALTVSGVAPIVVAQRATQNRIQDTRARWAARACLELTRARHARSGTVELLDSVALGSTVWCSTEELNPDRRIHANVADSAGLVRALGSPAQVASLLDWIDADDEPRDAGAEAQWYRASGRRLPRNAPLASVEELRLIRGFEELALATIERLFTVRGSGEISVNRAPANTLSAVSVLSDADIRRILLRRETGAYYDSPEQLVAGLRLEPTTEEFEALSTRLSYVDDHHVVRATGVANLGQRNLETSLSAGLRENEAGLSIIRVEVR